MEEKLRQRGSHCLKVVIFGPESTGKTTLAMQLARHFNTVFVPEFSRIHAENQLLKNKLLTKEDVMIIADGQMKLENKLSLEANKILICDTDLLETKIYSEVYYDGYCPSELSRFAIENRYDLYFLTNIDIPWEADSIRDKPEGREELFNIFEATLKEYQKPYFVISGNENERLKQTIQHIDNLIR